MRFLVVGCRLFRFSVLIVEEGEKGEGGRGESG